MGKFVTVSGESMADPMPVIAGLFSRLDGGKLYSVGRFWYKRLENRRTAHFWRSTAAE